MSATNSSTNYSLPLFVPTDKPAWLVDWNGAMSAIDTAIKQAQTAADIAGTDIGTLQSDIVSINAALTSVNSAVSQLRLDTNSNTGAINTIQELIGNGTPTTTDKTIIGAINEINAEIKDFNLTKHGTVTITPASNVDLSSGSRNMVKYLLNNDGSVGKIYGGLSFINRATRAIGNWVTFATLSGIDSLPATTSAYSIEIGSFPSFIYPSGNNRAFYGARLQVKTDGTIDVQIKVEGAAIEVDDYIGIDLSPCLYFFKDLGD